jgi:cyclin H
MDFELSTQAKHWMFDEASLVECRQRAAVVQSIRNSKGRVRKFASGFGQQSNIRLDSIKISPYPQTDPEPNLSSNDQETLVHFHAHQIQRLIGPNAIFPGLQRSASSLSTAIMIFRRFYLSNSVIDFHPRNIAAASALLAVKVDCENKLEVSFFNKKLIVMYVCRFILYSLLYDI